MIIVIVVVLVVVAVVVNGHSKTWDPQRTGKTPKRTSGDLIDERETRLKTLRRTQCPQKPATNNDALLHC
jgi:hypothetical protein